MTSKNREAFEVGISDDGKWSQGLKLTKEGTYYYLDTVRCWSVGQAAILYRDEQEKTK